MQKKREFDKAKTGPKPPQVGFIDLTTLGIDCALGACQLLLTPGFRILSLNLFFLLFLRFFAAIPILVVSLSL